jgi:DNA (cytosine-5)-methyltransferase 1
MTAFYSENDPFMADWLERLIAAGRIAAGVVDDRSITDVRAEDLAGYSQCHFFAGIGGWAYALRLAGWPDDRPVWTGSVPCQPLSGAGQRKGHADQRHLWPAFYRLIAECAPAVVFGEQVASADGREWLAGVRADLERVGYAVGAADLCAAGAGAPHIRQRLFWVADRTPDGRREERALSGGIAAGDRAQGRPAGLVPGGASGGLADGNDAGPQGRDQRGHGADQRPARPPSVGGFWSDYDIVHCSDGKARRTQSGVFPLAHGVPARVGRLRAYGNAIVPALAAAFIAAAFQARERG